MGIVSGLGLSPSELLVPDRVSAQVEVNRNSRYKPEENPTFTSPQCSGGMQTVVRFPPRITLISVGDLPEGATSVAFVTRLDRYVEVRPWPTHNPIHTSKTMLPTVKISLPSPAALTREVSRNAGIASAALVFEPWSAMARVLIEVSAIAETVVLIVEKLMRATHSIDAVAVTSRPVASPASDWAADTWTSKTHGITTSSKTVLAAGKFGPLFSAVLDGG